MENEKKSILLTGGLGYIGSHTAVELLSEEYLSNLGISDRYEIVIVDDLSNSSESILNRLKEITKQKITLYQFSILDTDALDDLLSKHNFYAVIHFAGKKSVAERF